MQASARADPIPATLREDWVAYVGPFTFPWGQAASRRVAGIAASIVDSGHDVVVISGGEPPGARLIQQDRSGGRLWLVGTGDQPPPNVGLVRRNVALHGKPGAGAVAWLDAQTTRPGHVIVYGGGLSNAVRLRTWSHRHHVPVIADVVEWYAARQFAGGLASPSWVSAHLALRLGYRSFDGIIAISTHLHRHYARLGLQVVTVPPTLDVSAVSATPSHTQPQGDVILCYFGTPGRKDLLPEILEGFTLARTRAPAGTNLLLRVAGPAPGEVARAAGGAIPSGVNAVGRLPQEEVSHFVRDADYSLLLRQRARFSEAGFPTKFVESLAHGTPVIANLTSDLGRYLMDGVNGFVATSPTATALADAIAKGAGLAGPERSAMRARAYDTALAAFDYRAYTQPIQEFLERVRS